MYRTVFAIFTLFLLCSCGTPRSAAGLLVAPIQLGDKSIKAEIASSPAELSRGLMYRRELDWNKGMLFVYPEERILSFWMKNTFIPLSIAFIDRDGTITHIARMKPQDLTSHRSPGPVQYALEMNLGWFEKAGVGVGDTAAFTLPTP